MIDFFHKGASITKRIEGTAKLVGVPKINARPKMKITKIGRFEKDGNELASILLEEANNSESRRTGLMGRSEIPEIYGMLFSGLSDGGYFWMKDCLVPIDVAFVDKDGNVTKTYEMDVDEGKKHYEYDEEDVMAVEVKGGCLKKWGVEAGSGFVTKDISSESSNG